MTMLPIKSQTLRLETPATQGGCETSCLLLIDIQETNFAHPGTFGIR